MEREFWQKPWKKHQVFLGHLVKYINLEAQLHSPSKECAALKTILLPPRGMVSKQTPKHSRSRPRRPPALCPFPRESSRQLIHFPDGGLWKTGWLLPKSFLDCLTLAWGPGWRLLLWEMHLLFGCKTSPSDWWTSPREEEISHQHLKYSHL